MGDFVVPSVKLSRDDNYAVYVQGDTTLVLSGTSFIASQARLRVTTQRLIVYADKILFPGQTIRVPGKHIELYCNQASWSDSQVLDLSGEAGPTIAAAAAQSECDGGSGGSLVLHIHDLAVDSGPTAWPVGFKVNVSGGVPGKCHRASNSTDWLQGNPGPTGSVVVYYGNQFQRWVSSLYDLYGSQELSLPERLRTMATKTLPHLQQEANELYAQAKLIASDEASTHEFHVLTEEVASVAKLTDDMLALFETMARIVQYIDEIELTGSSAELAQTAAARINEVQSLRDYSFLCSELTAPVTELLQALEAVYRVPWGQQPTSEQNTKLAQGLQRTISVLDSKANVSGGETTAMAESVDRIWNTLQSFRSMIEQVISESVAPVQASRAVPVSYTSLGMENTNIPHLMVHPDQCQMLLRQADSFYFANALDDASRLYQYLFERLAFAPTLSTLLKQEPQKPPQVMKAIQHLEANQLSHWTLEALAYVYAQVCIRLDQIRMGSDLFGLPHDTAPRLSYRYYSDSAMAQILRLKGYEKSFWGFWDSYQVQMRDTQVLGEGLSVNVYHTKQINEDISRAIETMQAKERSIESGAVAFNKKKKALVNGISEVKGALGGFHWPGAGSFVTALTSLVVAGAFVASGPAGWATLGMASLAAGSSLWQIGDDAYKNMTDDVGNKVNKKFVVSQLTTCEGDVSSVLGATFQMNDNGTISVNDEDTRKIAVTESQLKTFLGQFKDSIPKSKQAALSQALDEFTEASKARNNDIMAYTQAVITLYEKHMQKRLSAKQAEQIGSEVIRESLALPSIVAFYQRLRNDSRFGILRSVKKAALALRFWGLLDTARFDGPSLLSSLDEMEAHLGVLLSEYEKAVSRFSSFSRLTWPSAPAVPGILYRLSDQELGALRTPLQDPYAGAQPTGDFVKMDRVYTVVVSGLKEPATRQTSFLASPFAGHANVRISQVRFFAPGIRLASVKKTEKTAAEMRLLHVELQHGGDEVIVDPDNVQVAFRHWPVQLASSYKWTEVVGAADIGGNVSTSRQLLPSDWMGANSDANTHAQAPIGPFTSWRVTIRETVNGKVDWTGVSEAYLEFCGSSSPFR